MSGTDKNIQKGMKTLKKISVIIPCYNVAAYIDRCLLSVTAQTIGIENLEIICVDDASTDATWSCLKRWKQVFPDYILLIRQEENRRQGAARNIGLQHASAEWISFVDADDWLELDFFERLYRPTEEHVCDVAACEFIRDALTDPDFSGNGRQRTEGRYIDLSTTESKKRCLTDKLLGAVAHSKIVRRRLLIDNRIFFPEDLVYEDHYWVPLLSIYASGIYLTDEQLYHYFWNPDSTVLSRNQDHHLDGLTVEMIKWVDYEERGLMTEYHEELEYDLLRDAVDFVQVILLWRDEIPFSFFKLQSVLIRERVPAPEKNRYYHQLSKVDHVLLEALYAPADKAGFEEIAGRCVPEYMIDGK